jgi:hypothetical protein
MNKKAKSANNVFDRRQYELFGKQKDTVINVILIEHHPDSLKSPTYKASNDGVGMGGWAKVTGSYHLWKYPQVVNGDTIKFGSWNMSGLFIHELGHCLGLQHTWAGNDGCDDTPKNPGCWNYGEPPCDVVSNNVMDYNAYQDAITPCQLAKVNHNFFRDAGQRRFINEDWCKTDNSNYIIRGNVTWSRLVDMQGNILIRDKSALTIECDLSLPPGAKIILQPKATLILNGGSITTRCTAGEWNGIEIMISKKAKPRIILSRNAAVTRVIHPITPVQQ